MFTRLNLLKRKQDVNFAICDPFSCKAAAPTAVVSLKSQQRNEENMRAWRHLSVLRVPLGSQHIQSSTEGLFVGPTASPDTVQTGCQHQRCSCRRRQRPALLAAGDRNTQQSEKLLLSIPFSAW